MVNNRVAQDFDTVKDDLGQIRKDFAELAQAILDAGRSGAKDAREKLEQEAQRRLDQLRDTAHSVRARGAHAVESVHDVIEERPFTSVLVAFGIGLIIGKILDRK